MEKARPGAAVARVGGALIALVGFAVAGPWGSPASAQETSRPWLVTFQPNIGPQAAAQIIRRSGFLMDRALGPLPVYAVHARNYRDAEVAADRLRADPRVSGADPDGEQSAQLTPNDPLFLPFQWNLRRIGMEQAWDLHTSASDVLVAVLDTGADTSHPDLRDNLLPDLGYNFIADSPDVQDDESHGTAVAGIIGAVGNNRQGVAGIAWHVKIVPIKTLNSEGRGPDSAAVRGIQLAADAGARVLNISSTGSRYSAALQSAVQYALDKGAIIVAAAGNNGSGSTDPSYPAALDGVLAVSAVDEHDHAATFSQHGAYIELAAPGVDIPSTSWSGAGRGLYASQSGTSIAAPHVSGAAALLASLRPDFSGGDITALLRATADPPVAGESPSSVGSGVLNVGRAVATARLGLAPRDPSLTANRPPGPVGPLAPVPIPSPMPPTQSRWYFAEGSTRPPFDVTFAVQNPNSRAIVAHFAFLLPDGTQRMQELSVPALGRADLRAADVVPGAEFGSVVTADSAMFVERSMYFGHDGHSAIGARSPEKSWYLAEGSTAPPFDTWILLLNPGPEPATATLTFLREDGTVSTQVQGIPPQARRSIYANAVLPAGGFSTQVTSDRPIVVERSMYMDGGQGGHVAMGITSPARTWYLAAGASRSGLDTWLLVQNPNPTPASVLVSFYTEDGAAATQPLLVRPHARASLLTGLVVKSAAYGMRVDADQPVIVEESIYADSGRSGLNSPGIAKAAPEWFFPEGRTDGAFIEQLTVLNPQSVAASVSVSFQRTDGQPAADLVYQVPPLTPVVLDVNPYAPDARVALHIVSDRPIVAERTSYFATATGSGSTSSAGVPR